MAVFRRCSSLAFALALALPWAVHAQHAGLQKVVLDADARFAFGESALQPASRAALDDFAARLEGIAPGMIRLVGHADRLGSAAENQVLSEERADAVKDYLVGKGIGAHRLSTEGRGDTQPMTKAGTCGGSRSAKLIACLQPDRRVAVEVAGTRSIE